MKLARQTMYLCNPETMATRALKQFGCQVLLSFTYVGSIISPKVISTAGHSMAQKEPSKKATRKGKGNLHLLRLTHTHTFLHASITWIYLHQLVFLPFKISWSVLELFVHWAAQTVFCSLWNV